MSASSIIHVVARSADSTGDTIGRDASFDDAIAALAKKTGQASLRTGADCGLQPHTNYQLTSSRGGRHTSPVPNHHGDIKSTAELGCLHKTLDLGAPQNCTAFPLLITREIRGFSLSSGPKVAQLVEIYRGHGLSLFCNLSFYPALPLQQKPSHCVRTTGQRTLVTGPSGAHRTNLHLLMVMSEQPPARL